MEQRGCTGARRWMERRLGSLCSHESVGSHKKNLISDLGVSFSYCCTSCKNGVDSELRVTPSKLCHTRLNG